MFSEDCPDACQETDVTRNPPCYEYLLKSKGGGVAPDVSSTTVNSIFNSMSDQESHSNESIKNQLEDSLDNIWIVLLTVLIIIGAASLLLVCYYCRYRNARRRRELRGIGEEGDDGTDDDTCGQLAEAISESQMCQDLLDRFFGFLTRRLAACLG